MSCSSSVSYTLIPETEPQIDHVIDIPKDIKPGMFDLCCIYKIPHHVRMLNNGESYTPHLISIGPFHRTNERLKSMHRQKQRYFLAFWERVKHKKALVKHKTFIKENTAIIKSFYYEFDNYITDDEFVDMILLDSVFILELFLRNSNSSEREKDYMFTTSWIYKSTQRDLLLLENQLPIFLLEQLYQRFCKDSNKNDLSFLQLAFNYFQNFNPQPSDEEMLKNCKSCKHFTDLIRCFYLPKHIYDRGWSRSTHFTKVNSEEDEFIVKTATMLYGAGVTFEKGDHKNLLEIKLDQVKTSNCLPCLKLVKSNLQIPQFRLDRNKEYVLRNLMALELCHYSEQPFICNYVSLIDSLINTQEDVELLVNKEIIVHKLISNGEMVAMINNMSKNVVVTHDYYGNISRKLNGHYRYGNRWRYYVGVLKSVYFSDPWRISSTVVGVVFFFFGIISFLQLVGIYKPNTS